MVRRIVPENDRVLPPALVLAVQDLYQVLKINCHDIGVGVGLEKAEILPTMAVHSSDESYSRPNHLNRQGIISPFHLPFPPSEVRFPKPSFINVNEPRFGVDKLEEPESTLLP